MASLADSVATNVPDNPALSGVNTVRIPSLPNIKAIATPVQRGPKGPNRTFTDGLKVSEPTRRTGLLLVPRIIKVWWFRPNKRERNTNGLPNLRFSRVPSLIQVSGRLAFESPFKGTSDRLN